MHSYLIIGGEEVDRMKKESELCTAWHTKPCDIIRLSLSEQKQTIGIDDIRVLEKNLSLSPRASPLMVGSISNAETLTPEAQNALLKTLEEPPPKTRIILHVQNSMTLLPTIISRCQVIQLNDSSTVPADEKTKIIAELLSFEQKKPGAVLYRVSQLYPTKEEGKQYIDTLIHILHETIRQQYRKEPGNRDLPWSTLQLVRNIKHAIQAQKQLAAHVNHLFVLDAFFRTISLDKQ